MMEKIGWLLKRRWQGIVTRSGFVRLSALWDRWSLCANFLLHFIAPLQGRGGPACPHQSLTLSAHSTARPKIGLGPDGNMLEEVWVRVGV